VLTLRGRAELVLSVSYVSAGGNRPECQPRVSTIDAQLYYPSSSHSNPPPEGEQEN
jgi:hypothetical protein